LVSAVAVIAAAVEVVTDAVIILVEVGSATVVIAIIV